MVDISQSGFGWWWRATDYVVSGKYVRPAPACGIERYDPWDCFAADEFAETETLSRPPHEELLGLIQRFNFEPRPGPGPIVKPDETSANELAAWCSRYGLLGILPHHALQIALLPRWLPYKSEPTTLVPSQIVYARTAAGWSTFIHQIATPRWRIRDDHPTKTGMPISPFDKDLKKRLITKNWPSAGVIMRELRTGMIYTLSLSEMRERYFPDVPAAEAETYFYPAPTSEKFWRSYAEPIWDFVEISKTLTQAISVLGRREPLKSADPKAREVVQVALDRLHDIVGHVSPCLSPNPDDDGSFRQDWCSTSLIGTLGMMCLLDLRGTKWTMVCANDKCKTMVFTKAYQRRYCSPRCQRTVAKRRYRKKQAIMAAGNTKGGS